MKRPTMTSTMPSILWIDKSLYSTFHRIIHASFRSRPKSRGTDMIGLISWSWPQPAEKLSRAMPLIASSMYDECSNEIGNHGNANSEERNICQLYKYRYHFKSEFHYNHNWQLHGAGSVCLHRRWTWLALDNGGFPLILLSGVGYNICRRLQWWFPSSKQSPPSSPIYPVPIEWKIGFCFVLCYAPSAIQELIESSAPTPNHVDSLLIVCCDAHDVKLDGLIKKAPETEIWRPSTGYGFKRAEVLWEESHLLVMIWDLTTPYPTPNKGHVLST